MKLKEYIAELKRRNVFKAAIAYLIMAWIIIQVSSVVLEGFNAPTYVFKIILFVICIGFPFWLVFSWVYDVTPEGIKKTDDIEKNDHAPPNTKNRLNKVIIVSLSIVVVFLLFEQYEDYIIKKNIENKLVTTVEKEEKSIVVLPFLNLSENNRKDYLADGITEAINLELSKKDSLRVISRTSAMSYKDENKLLSDIAKELEVDYLLEGSILFDVDSLKIIVQLIESFPREKHVWANSYTEKNDNILQLVEKISTEIANEINTVVLPNKTNYANHKVDSKAYELYLRGLYLMNLETANSTIRAIEYLKEAIKMDSNYAPAYAALAESYISMNKFESSYDAIQKNEKNGRVAIDKALMLDNTSGAAFITKGKIAGLCDWNWDEMKKLAEIGLKLEPENSKGHVLLSNYHLVKNDYNEAINEALLAEKLNPLNPMIGSLVAERYYLAHNYEKSIEQYKKVLEFFPNYGFAWEGLGYTQFVLGQKEEAIYSWKRLQEILGNESMAINFVFAGNAEESFRLWLSKAKTEPLSYTSKPTILALVHMLLNEKDEALSYLEIAYKVRDDDLPIMLLQPHFYDLRKEPRFKDLVKKTGVII